MRKMKGLIGLLVLLSCCICTYAQNTRFEIKHQGKVLTNDETIEIRELRQAADSLYMKFEVEITNLTSGQLSMALKKETIQRIGTAATNTICWSTCPDDDDAEITNGTVDGSAVATPAPYALLWLNAKGDAVYGTTIVKYTFSESGGHSTIVTVRYVYPEPPTHTTVNGLVTLRGEWNKEQLLTLNLSDPELIGLELSECTFPADAVLPEIGNPNLLIYVESSTTEVPSTWGNVVKSTTASGIIITDGYPFRWIKKVTARNVKYIRDFPKEGVASICLPFKVTATTLAKAGVTVESFASSTGTVISFEAATSIVAHTPYLLKISSPGEKELSFTQSVTFAFPAVKPKAVTQGDYTFVGTDSKLAGADVAEQYILSSDGTGFRKANSTNTIPAFRAYIQYTGPASSSTAETLSFNHGGSNATGSNRLAVSPKIVVSYLDGGTPCLSVEEPLWTNIYSVNGSHVEKIYLAPGLHLLNLPQGIYLVEGQKVIVK